MWPPENQLGIPDYALDLCRTVEARTGKPIRVTERIGAYGFDSELRVAMDRDPTHVLAYQEAYRPYRDHFLVSSCYKLLRLWDTAPEERMLPAIMGDRLPVGWHRELERGFRGSLSEEEIAGISSVLHAGVIRQVHSFPVDLRVEREIAATLPEHAGRQRAYFARQVEDLMPHFSLTAAGLAPRPVYRAVSAMNVVLGMEAAAIAGVEEPRQFRESRYRWDGEDLHRQLAEETAPGHVGDRAVTDRWALTLELRPFYLWVPWEKAVR